MSEQKKPEIDLREDLIAWHCKLQQCVGCPKEYECDEAEAEREAHEEEQAEYDGEEYDYY